MEKLKEYLEYSEKILFILLIFTISFSIAIATNFFLDLKLFKTPDTKVKAKKIKIKKTTNLIGLNYLFPIKKTIPLKKKKIQSVSSLTSLKLKGTITLGNLKIAIIDYRNKTYYLKIGDIIGNYKVKDIKNFYITLEKDNREYKLYLSLKGSSTSFNRNKLKENKFKVKKDEIKDINVSDVLRSISIVPALRGGQLIGWRIVNIRKDSLFARYGLRKGDIILSVNGIPANKISSMAVLKQELENSEDINLEVKRGSETIEIYIEMEE